MNKTILLVCAIWLSGCSVIQPKPADVVQVKIPVPVDCLGEIPKKPNFISDADLIELESAEFVKALHTDRLQRDIYETLLEAAIEGCKL